MADYTSTFYERKLPRTPGDHLRLTIVPVVILLALINAALLWLKPLANVDPESLPAAHTWVWWATKEFQELKQPPAVVILGSSLLMHPLERIDADYLHENVDYVTHHRCIYMENRLAKELDVSRSTVFNFALPGGMASDDYMVARSLFSGLHKPSVIVLGLGLRDFIDNGVHCAGATPAFKYLKRYTDISDLVDMAMPQIFQRSDYWLGNAIYLWGKKLDLQVLLAEQTKSILVPRWSRMFKPSQLSSADSERDMPSNLRSEIEKGVMLASPNMPASWDDNTAEYKRRFRSSNDNTFNIQLSFLNKLCELANQKRIKVVIVNMPLTPKNHALMPLGSYDRYVTAIKQTARIYDCEYLDLDHSGKFDYARDYYDTAHMNSSGGRKLVDAMVEFFKERKPVVAALKCANKEQPIADRANAM